MFVLFALALGLSVLTAYALIEKRINQRSCATCGSKVSVDADSDECPRCKPNAGEESVEDLWREGASIFSTANRLSRNWAKIVLIGAPLAIILTAAGLLLAEQLETDTDAAIRLVKESTSRKENFTIQQYLYFTIYHRKDQGEPITIEGWRAERTQIGDAISVEFTYTDVDGRHVALWETSVREKKVSPRNEAASEISAR